MTVDDFFRNSGGWLAPGGAPGVVVSSRIRLARNLEESAFPGWAGAEECGRIWRNLREIITAFPPLRDGFVAEMPSVDELGRQILFERHLISRELAEKQQGSGVVISADERISVMINEEDHLRMQSMRPGLDLRQAWQVVDGIDTAIERQTRYAFSLRLGYLTACPTNVGTGMRASAMLHLPGLVLMNEINPIVKGMSKIGLAVRGLWGEGTEASGNMFQVSNQISLGESEAATIANLEQIVMVLVEHEHNARARLQEKRDYILRDHVGRAYGILAHAHILTSREALDLLSGLRLGLDLGILKDINRRVIDELWLLVQPGHLQKVMGRKLKPKDRDWARAELVRSRLAVAERRLSPGSDGNKHE